MKIPASARYILTLNGGSSSLKFSLFENGPSLACAGSGKIDGAGKARAALTAKIGDKKKITLRIDASQPVGCLAAIFGAIEPVARLENLKAVGHRVVHGGARHAAPEKITPKLLRELHRLSPLDPEHLPAEIKLIEAIQKRFPTLPQFACFDTAFHSDLPRQAQLLPLPRRYEKAGVRRYGFHGLSYQFLMEELVLLKDPAARKGRVILAHLGNGASMAAVLNGKSIDTSMGFTPAAGLVMSTRTGDLDPGVVAYLARTEKMSAVEFQHLVTHESGLLGVSGISGDMRVLLKKEMHHRQAAEAVSLFCYQAKKWIGAYAAALGGVDTLVFAGGIGENCPSIRSRICEGLEFLGISIDQKSNKPNAGLISKPDGRVAVRVIRTDEELMIARSVAARLRSTQRSK
jgi:acetate kinase